MQFLRQAWFLARPYWVGNDRWPARALFAALMLAKFTTIYVCVQLNHWYNSFYTAIQSRDLNQFWDQVFLFGMISLGITLCYVFAHWISEALKLRWRNWLVHHYTSEWLSNQNYYQLQVYNTRSTNPDQRITEDMGIFAGQSIGIVSGFLDVAVSTVAFSSILWNLSGNLEIAGYNVPGYILLAAFAYTAVSSWLTHVVGNPLVKRYEHAQSLEGDFRYSLMRLKENAETVAFYRGEAQEKSEMLNRWALYVSNFRTIIHGERNLGWFVHGYHQVNIIFPFLLVVPRYFSGSMTFGEVMQVSAAFGAVNACLSFFINSYKDIANWQATTNRLLQFRSDMDQLAQVEGTRRGAQIHEGDQLRLIRVGVDVPGKGTIIPSLDLTIEAGRKVLLRAPSGYGKSTLLRTIAGIWSSSTGNVMLPRGEAFFVPQRPYLPLGTLRKAVCYPHGPDYSTQVDQILQQVGLGHLIAHLDEVQHWANVLSGGEQQRLAFARIFLAKPATIFLDESTSALDEEWERRMYTMLREADWNPTVLSIGHRNTLAAYHDEVLDMAKPQLVAAA